MGNPNCCFMIIAVKFFFSSQSPRGTVYWWRCIYVFIKLNYCKNVFLFLIHFFARDVLAMKRLEIEKTKSNFFTSVLKVEYYWQINGWVLAALGQTSWQWCLHKIISVFTSKYYFSFPFNYTPDCILNLFYITLECNYCFCYFRSSPLRPVPRWDTSSQNVLKAWSHSHVKEV